MSFLYDLWIALLMNPIFCRIYQFFFGLTTTFSPYPKQEITEGKDCINDGAVVKILAKKKITSVLLVTDKGLTTLHMTDTLTESLTKSGIAYTLYDNTVSNPTIDNVEEALKCYHDNNCKAIIAFGGGSPMDCAKGVGARVSRPGKTVKQMKGLFGVLFPTPPIIAIPTTSGTGSEATMVSIINDNKTHEKFSLTDFSLMPRFIILDPLLTVKCPPHITSTVGMDALAHAVESYLNNHNTRDTNKKQVEAVHLIFANIHKAYADGSDVEARSNMQHAAYLGGYAITRKMVGNVHAIAHQLGGIYGTPHGLATAVILPYILELYGKYAHARLSALSAVVNLKEVDDTDEQAANKFIKAIRDLNESMNIPTKLPSIREEDIPLIANRAALEANPLYPSPCVFSFADFEAAIRLLKAEEE